MAVSKSIAVNPCTKGPESNDANTLSDDDRIGDTDELAANNGIDKNN